MKAFLTGSHVYGNPRPDSDIDLVVMVDEYTATILRTFANVKKGEALRFGRINLILCTTDAQWRVWEEGTRQMREKKSWDGRTFSKQEAKEVFDTLRQRYCIVYNGESSDEEEAGVPMDDML